MPLAPTSAVVWAIENSPSPSGSNSLLGVTCTSASDCWAVGGDSGIPLTEHWNGTSWSVVLAAFISGYDQFNGVTCASASDCWAVGWYGQDPSNILYTLIEHWDGTSWSIVTSLNSGSVFNILNGVTCASASDCWAVGYDESAAFSGHTLIEHWDGTSWAIASSPNAGDNDELLGVTCTSASNCWAVGSSSSGTQTLIEQWDGTSWSIITSPSLGVGNVLNSVTCASPSACWAVGYTSPCGGCAQTFIEQWDGTSWSIVPSPNNGANPNLLNSVTCASASDCWAVGSYANGGSLIPFTLIEQWDGTLWSIVSSPNYPPSGSNFLLGVTCASASDCWAVGSYQGGGGSPLTLIEQYTTNAVKITTSSSPSAGGTTSGGSTYVRGSSVTVTATANSGYVFTDWTQNGSIVSTSASYTFRLNANRALVANFNSLVPEIGSISPSSATAGGPGFTLTVNGSNFGSGSKVHWNNSVLTTTFFSSTQVTASVPSSDIRTAGTVSVTVVNPPPGGGTSNAITFTINNPVPAIGSISPSSATAGGPGFTLTVHGSNFGSGSVVDWNGSARSTTFSSRTMLMASISAADIATAGTASVTVVNAPPGGGTSNAKAFTINP